MNMYSLDLSKWPVTIGTPKTTTYPVQQFLKAAKQDCLPVLTIEVGTASSSVRHIVSGGWTGASGSTPKVLACEVANTSAATMSIFEVGVVSNAVKILSRSKNP